MGRDRDPGRIRRTLLALLACGMIPFAAASCNLEVDGSPSGSGSGSGSGVNYDVFTTGVPIDALTQRTLHSAVWTGSEMIVWGGYDDSNELNTGGRYNPVTNSWFSTPLLNAPEARQRHTAVWAGNQMIIWGGVAGINSLQSGGKFDPVANRWEATTTAGSVPSGRFSHTAVWSGSVMIVWGGHSGVAPLDTGGRYNPTLDTWDTVSTTNAPTAVSHHTAIWDTVNNQMIIWGGNTGANTGSNAGGVYSSGNDTWVALGTAASPLAQRYSHTAVWTGSEMIVWGGVHNVTTYRGDGAKYTPANGGQGSWVAIAGSGGGVAPSARTSHVAIWDSAHSAMIIWGGTNGTGEKSDGAYYTVGTDAWTTMNNGATRPTSRYSATGVWSTATNEAIIWGGSGAVGIGSLGSGARFSVTGNSWTPTP